MDTSISKNTLEQANDSALGKTVIYDQDYNPSLLFPISRSGKRQEIGIDPQNIPFYGLDYWNHYEVSWLNSKGKPEVAIAEIAYDCSSPNIVESKSLKLYFNSFNNSRFASASEVKAIVQQDLEKAIASAVSVKLLMLDNSSTAHLDKNFKGECIDELDIECSIYTVHPEFLSVGTELVEETLYSNLLKSNCLVTNQPDWGSVQIQYKGNQINREGLLKYLVSFRNHNEFHEQCIERIYVDIMRYCKPVELTVYGRYTRRGGLDINPYRSSKSVGLKGINLRLVRQ
ncbi:NADPH-dependent 7-cyano-7-deazaguanine reductase QueF [Legionella waltersii]|uniref:NADPH-dependent 7-cyano-7-deazaguanine reductase n=1 Tax=Legionella waltersii TaxID=66969 RepID=A0A0W1AN03_9GAMM|nr:NADPH-dependent 7-cyano-7-deazaguanine reductase QueF [Legionella waltersii]KTD82713.1 GTP cyclohydrolase [Legionella waltersii]SNV03419.1 GTP cyclohydrolase [Legionella waltersii]